ncbi:site-2 protease family protein [Streptomyces sp. 6N223]|uniref:site-2 protease family protein n=1 Tax=Streptomyces sp. 6N223 TaxID=3457412 RepID=UPI003FD50C6F
MKATFTLGRIAGVRIGVHWSVLVIFGLIAFGLAAGRLPEAHPDRAWVAYALAGLITAVVFFASLLAHELAHAVVARRNGVPVDDIVLWLLGGATRMRAEAPNPGAELRISGVGPLVSLALGAAFTLLTLVLVATAGSDLVAESVAWLAAINILLAVFNAIPAAPLDGGRLLRAYLWWRTGDRLRATAGASKAGRVFGWVLVGLGLWGFVWAASFGALWLSLIGWFLVVAATEEERQARLRELLSGVPVRETMTPDPVTVPSGLTVDRFLSDPDYTDRFRHSAFPVTGEGEKALGLVTRQRAERVAAPAHRRTTLGEIMLPLAEARTARPGDALAELLPRLEPGADQRVLVVEGERLVGIVSPSDVSRTVRWLSAHRGEQGEQGDGGRGGGTGPTAP